MEEKILAMRGGRNGSQTSLPLPSSGPTAPGSSPRKEEPGWWQAARTRLNPNKELTAAQQIIQETKSKDKEAKKGKGKEAKPPTRKTSDPALLHLDIPQGGGYRPGSASPTDNRPSGEHTPSREYPGDSRPSPSPGIGMSPASKAGKDGDNAPIYAKFTPLGALDVPETLLTIARRFEKLERWTVGHVRALEDRVGDVEKWLVDKEEARQAAEEAREREFAENKKIIGEMKSRGDELKRATEEGKRISQQVTRDLQQTVEREVERAIAKRPSSTVTSQSSEELEVAKRDILRLNAEISSVKESLVELGSNFADLGKMVSTQGKGIDFPGTHSPAPLTVHHTGGMGSTSSRSRLPYPSGDYASGDGMTPPASPPPVSLGSTGRAAIVASPSSVPLPTTPGPRTAGSQTALNANRPQVKSTNSHTSLDIPPKRSERPASTSPTPRNRKRYTVALGGPLTSPLEQLQQNFEEANKDAEPAPQSTGDSPVGIKLIGSSAFSRDSPSPVQNGHGKEETIGGTPIDLSRVASLSPPSGNTPVGSLNSSSRTRGQDTSPGSSRIRAQSAYGAPTGWGSMSKNIGSTPPLRPRRRSGDTSGSGQGEFGAMGAPGNASATGSATKFVDPLLLRKKDREGLGPPKLPVPRSGKTSFGELLAFFDGEKKEG